MRSRRQRIRVRSRYRMTLKDVDESEGQASCIDRKESHVIGPAKDLFAPGQGQVEDEDGSFDCHQRRILGHGINKSHSYILRHQITHVEDGKGIVGTVETRSTAGWDIIVVKAQTLAGRVEERKGEAEVDQLRMISFFFIQPSSRQVRNIPKPVASDSHASQPSARRKSATRIAELQRQSRERKI